MEPKTQGELLREAVTDATYCRVVTARGFQQTHPGERASHVGFWGEVQNKASLTFTNGKFSVNTKKQPPGVLKPTGADLKAGEAPHHWVYPYKGDSVQFYDTACKAIGVWDGVNQKFIRQGVAPVAVSKDVLRLQEGAALFTPTTVKTKGGYRAQVLFQSSNKVVWESTEVYADDDNFQWEDYDDGVRGQGKSGQTKAQEAAAGVVDKVVEGLFDNVG